MTPLRNTAENATAGEWERRIDAMLAALGHSGRAGVFHCTNDDRSITIDELAARDILTAAKLVLGTKPDTLVLAAFASEAASYFENRPTGGEDAAHWSNVYNAENCRKIVVALSELDTARAEIDRLRERLRDIIDERDNLSTIIATEIDDVAGAELDDMEERATRAESALTAAQARIAELERLQQLVRVFLDNNPDEAVADSGETVLDLFRYDARATLSPAVKEPK